MSTTTRRAALGALASALALPSAVMAATGDAASLDAQLLSLVAAAYPLRAAVLVEENADDSVALGERSLLLQSGICGYRSRERPH